jgi:hypothetical protein
MLIVRFKYYSLCPALSSLSAVICLLDIERDFISKPSLVVSPPEPILQAARQLFHYLIR